MRISPWSTSTQVSWSPTARWTSAAAVAESTPPERPQITPASPTCGADPLDLLVDHRGGRPVGVAARDLGEEALQDLLAVRRVHDLGVKLDPVEPALGVLERGDRRAGARGERVEAGRRLEDRVAVAHPALLLARQPGEQPPAVAGEAERGAPELARLGALDRPPSSSTIACIP